MSMSPYMQRLRDKVGSELLMVPGVSALIRDASGGILLIRRVDDGHWDLPAGLIDPGETPAAAIRREVHEETGLWVEPTRILTVLGGRAYRHTYPGGDRIEALNVIFACQKISGELTHQPGETDGVAYFAPDQLPASLHYYPDWLWTHTGPEARFES